jgi:hypothetical protein
LRSSWLLLGGFWWLFHRADSVRPTAIFVNAVVGEIRLTRGDPSIVIIAVSTAKGSGHPISIAISKTLQAPQ